MARKVGVESAHAVLSGLPSLLSIFLRNALLRDKGCLVASFRLKRFAPYEHGLNACPGRIFDLDVRPEAGTALYISSHLPVGIPGKGTL